MKILEIHKLAIEMGIDSDFRGRKTIEKILENRKQKFQKAPEKEKEFFDKEQLSNPYLDSRVLNIAEDKDIKKVLFGIDMESAEIMLAKELDNIDLVISHHPLGVGLACLSDVMELQCDVLAKYGVPINIAEGLMSERISEVARGLNAVNHQRTVDTARILNVNLICLHTACDNLAAKFLKEKIEKENPERIGDLVNLLKQIPEYREAEKFGAGPQIFVGEKDKRCGRIAVTEITGGTQGSPLIYEKMAQAGIGTVVGMHLGKEHWQEAKKALINIVIAGHMSSDSLGINQFVDELEKKGIEVIPCSGFIRVKR